jgi:ureidoglycolate lyase
MKLVTFDAGNTPELGIVVGTAIVPLTRTKPQLAASMIDLIQHWGTARAEVEEVAAKGEAALPLGSVRLLAPIPRPGKIWAIGLNYADHIAESGMETPKNQIWFSKAVSSVNGPYDAIELPSVPKPHVDYEAELVAVIGAGGRHIPAANAANAIFGYCVGNDVTERAWQHAGPQWSLGKSFDTHAPFGPWIVTADEIPDPHSLGIRCLVNGETRQQSNTRHLVFDLWDQVAHLSSAMTLEPGDVIYTGTPGGVGAAMKPMQFLQDGDVVRVEIDGIGTIEAVCKADGRAQ